MDPNRIEEEEEAGQDEEDKKDAEVEEEDEADGRVMTEMVKKGTRDV